jgi:signal transduction histidine kinase
VYVDELVGVLQRGHVEGESHVVKATTDPTTERTELRLVYDYVVDQIEKHRLNASPVDLAVATEWYEWAERGRLLAENRYLSALLDGVEESALAITPHGRIAYINRRAAQVLYEGCGLMRDEVVGEIYSELGVHEQLGFARSPSDLLKRARAGGSSELVAWGRAKESTVQAVYDSEGDVAAVASIIRDVHGRKLGQRRLAVLSKLGMLVGRLDHDKVAEAVAKVPIPELADWCAVNLVHDGKIRRTFIAQRDPAKRPVRDALMRAMPHWERHPLWQEMLTSGFQLLTEVNDDLVRTLTVTPEQYRMLSGLGIRSMMVLPLVSRGQDAGIMTLLYTTESGRRYGRDDPELGEELALHAAHALENARLMSELRSREHQLAEALSFRERMMGILGHDLRNPLGVITIAAGLLLGRDDLQPEARDQVRRIGSAADRMNEMIGTLLDFARARFLGGLPVTPVAADLAEIARSVVDEMRAVTADPQIELVLSGDARGSWDPSRLSQLVSNLLGNAISYREPGTRIRVSVEGEGPNVTLRVTNQGPPVDADLLPIIFEPFRRGAPRDKSLRGLGLGLYIAKQIVIAHEGTIDVESTSEGTTFKVHLPRASPSSATNK